MRKHLRKEREVDAMFERMDVLLVRVETVADRLLAKVEEIESRQKHE